LISSKGYFSLKTTSIFTYLVFHHALRIRLKSDILDDDQAKDQAAAASDVESSLDTPTSTSANSSIVVDTQDDAPMPRSEVETEAVSNEAKEEQAQERTANLVGKINN
jgi:hypothetical protein